MGEPTASLRTLAWALVAVALLAGWYASVGDLAGGFPVHQIGANLPTPAMLIARALWWVLGAGVVLAAARALFVASEGARWSERLVAAFHAGDDRRWVAGTAALAFVASVLVSRLALGGRPLVLDESAYLFMARVLANGRLYAESYPDRVFYDRGFMVNDGKFYAQYFVGWPAMLAPFARFGLEQWANPAWFAATVPAVFGVLRKVAGSPWARVGALLFAVAPFAVFGAATQMAHIGCAFWLAWAFWFALRGADDDAPAWAAAGLAICFGAAFFVRPTTALGIGGPAIAWWAAARWGRKDGRRGRDALAFVLPGALLGAAFFAVNAAQNGDPWQVAYTRYQAYTAETPYLLDIDPETGIFDLSQTWRVLTGPFTALLRLDWALFGWPTSFLFVPFAIGAPRARLFFGSVAGMLGVHAFVHDPGIMAYGPVHYLEMVVPVTVLTVLGARALAAATAPAWAGRAALAVLGALVFASFAGYWPWRLQNLARIGAATAIPYDLVEDLDQAVVFTSNGRWLPHCVDERVHAFHIARPDNPPDLDAPVLWVNHLSVAHDRAFLARRHPGRTGWILHWDDRCRPSLLPLDGLGADDYPPAFRPKGMAAIDRLLPPLPEATP